MQFNDVGVSRALPHLAIAPVPDQFLVVVSVQAVVHSIDAALEVIETDLFRICARSLRHCPSCSENSRG